MDNATKTFETKLLTTEEITASMAELKKISDYCDPEWDDDNNCFRGSVWAPNSQKDGDQAYEAETEETLQSLRKALPGWVVNYTGNGNTDAEGTCTEDVTFTPPEGPKKMTIAEFYKRYSCKLRYDTLQEYFHLYVAIGHPRDVAYRYARTYWQHRRGKLR